MFTPRVLIYEQDAYVQTVSQNHKIGTIGETPEGREYRYVKVGAANIGAGKLELAPAPKTNHHNLVATAAPVASTQVTVTLGATAAVANEYAGGYVTISVAPGVGEQYEILSHPAANSSATLLLTLVRPIITAWTSATRANLVHNAWNGVVEAAVQTRRAAGVGMIGMTAGQFGWLLVKGVSPVLADGAIALGSLIVPSASVAGAVIAISGTYATGLITNLVGQATVMAGVDTEYRPMEFRIA